MPFDYFYGKQGGQYAFYRIPKLLFTDSRFETLSTDAKLLYGMLIDRMELSLKTGGLMNKGAYTSISRLTRYRSVSVVQVAKRSDFLQSLTAQRA